MLKLARNALAELKVIFNADGGATEWKYIQMLGKIQDEEGLHLANKLTTSHLQWWKQKMKVKLAAQTLSTSVADALEYLSNAKPEFKGAGPAIEFIRKV